MHRLIVPLLLMLLMSACNQMGDYVEGNGNIVEKNQNLEEFDEIRIRGNFNIILTESENPSLSITTDENLHQHIEVTQQGDQLMIESERNLKSDDGVDVVINYQNINRIEAGGASSITNRGVIMGDGFSLDLSGAGAVNLKVDLKKLVVNVSGAGSVELEGKADEQDISMSGAGGLDAEKLISKYTQVSLSGVGGAHVHVTEVLDANVSGVGGITYSGNPKEVRKDVSGLGSISKD